MTGEAEVARVGGIEQLSHTRPLETTYPPAAMWRRVLARIIDAVTVFFLLWVLVVLQVLFFMPNLVDAVDPGPWGQYLVPAIFFLVLHAVYEVVFHTWNRGQTPAKDLLKIRVERVADGADPTLTQSILRWVLPGGLQFVPPVPLGSVAVGLTATSAFDPDRRMLHDRIAGTRVVAFDRNAIEAEERGEDEQERPSLREMRREVRRMYGPRGPLDISRWVPDDSDETKRR